MRLHIVTGKGGTGKTTVAAALALALARQGKRVLLAEVEGRQGISQTFDVPPLGTRRRASCTTRGGGEVYGMSVDARAVAAGVPPDVLQARPGREGAGEVGAIDFATTIAPGLRDVLLIGKVYEAAGRHAGSSRHHGRPAYDAVVLDAPPTGRIVRFLNVNAEVADVAKVGPIRTQADSITRMLRSHRTAVHVVTLLEEMPVQETVDALAELTQASLPVGRRRRQPGPRAAPRRRATLETVGGRPRRAWRAAVTADLKAVVGAHQRRHGRRAARAEAAEHADRVALQQEQEAILHRPRPAGLPAAAAARGHRRRRHPRLADALTEQGMI